MYLLRVEVMGKYPSGIYTPSPLPAPALRPALCPAHPCVLPVNSFHQPAVFSHPDTPKETIVKSGRSQKLGFRVLVITKL